MSRHPIFPLPLVAFPGERVPLHIFEDRYKQLFRSCLQNEEGFVIVSVQGNAVAAVGTYCEEIQVHREYDDGRMDITCIARGRKRILKVYQDQAYLEAETVDLLDSQNPEETAPLLEKAVELFDEILLVADQNTDTSKLKTPESAFEFGHLLGLELSGKQRLLELNSEKKRLEFVLDHLKKALPRIQMFEQIQSVVRQNGHFKKFPPLNLSE